MLTVIMFLLGIVAAIVNANTNIVIASWIIGLLFGLTGILLIVQLSTWLFAKRTINAVKKEFFDDFKF